MSDYVIVPKSELVKLEEARIALYDLLANCNSIVDHNTFFLQIRLQRITEPMWRIANKKWDEYEGEENENLSNT